MPRTEKKISYQHTHGDFRYTIQTNKSNNKNSVHLTICSWIEPKYDFDTQQFFKKISNKLKSTADKNTIKYGFKPKSIVDVDIRYNNLKVDKKSFAAFDITLFNTPTHHVDVNRRTVQFGDSITEVIINEFSDMISMTPTKTATHENS